jgi:selenocysteine lyase/cysteine desulfurase
MLTLSNYNTMEPHCDQVEQTGDFTLKYQSIQVIRVKLDYRIIENILNHGIICRLSYIGGKVYCRISANIYNTEEDYQKLCQLILNQMEKK